jgi:hypothetical protein
MQKSGDAGLVYKDGPGIVQATDLAADDRPVLNLFGDYRDKVLSGTVAYALAANRASRAGARI